MTTALQHLCIDLEGKIRVYANNQEVDATPVNKPVLIEVDVREISPAASDGSYMRRLLQALDRHDHPASANAYIDGEPQRSYAEGYLWVPVQFYCLK